ncbi:hypothetical protein EOI86_09805 [Hwanghaeella grinnelliae]|uniref:DUF2214 domain-containing protein n=1 Tax=Hwanghaeella grinnelliae TaxID=2500179 RepID=A0A437QYA3_9PROT|nr:hypothetical protein [Hwanghaeella grinnelliae]RVU39501.1 hypothetical protein EOI86_09805 [Hwanghaeella grinnelliae]
MEEFLTALESLPPVEALRFSRWSYAAVNTGHVLGIALLVGGAVPLSLRLLGFWPDAARAAVVRILAVTAGSGLVLAVLTGILLFATRAVDYAAHPLLPFKLVLIAIGTVSAILAHRRHGWTLEDAPRGALRRIGAISLTAWLGALVLGRLIAFAAN